MGKSEAYKAAEQAKLEAEAAKARAEARVAEFQALKAEAVAAEAAISLAKNQETEAHRLVDDEHVRMLRFTSQVSDASVKAAVATLNRWNRLTPGCDITILLDSPGGSIIDGFHLFDHILEMRRQGHKVTIVAQGMAASMAGVLLQAGDVRVMTAQAALLIHEASFGAMGSYGQVEDQVKFVEKLQERILAILAERSTLSKRQIKQRWKRTNWWMLADEALKFGFVDEIR